jgi:hypothetical protein
MPSLLLSKIMQKRSETVAPWSDKVAHSSKLVGS